MSTDKTVRHTEALEIYRARMMQAETTLQNITRMCQKAIQIDIVDAMVSNSDRQALEDVMFEAAKALGQAQSSKLTIYAWDQALKGI